MKKRFIGQPRLFFVILSTLVPMISVEAGRPAQWLVYKKNDVLFDLKADHKGETVYVKNGDYLSGSPFDQYFYAQSTWDFTSHTRFGDKLNSKFTLREKVRWGELRFIPTTAEPVTLLDTTLPDHIHGFNRIVPFIRKAWVKFSFNDALDIKSPTHHYFKVGVFPFEVGRGISLGAAYAVSSGLLGFFAENSIDQYAFGGLIHGGVTSKASLTYDVYGSIVQNFSSSTSRNLEAVYPNCYTAPTIYRGYGAISYVLAGRLFWTVFENKSAGSLTAEPYVVYFRQPNNKIEYASDGNVKLGTFGLAVEYNGPRFELGFDTALNTGSQQVRAWDRNYVLLNRNTTTSACEEVYSHVYTNENYTDKAQLTNTNKTVVSKSSAGIAFNGEPIGTGNIITASGETSCTLYNGKARFRPEYRNLFGGHMFVIDGAYWLKERVLKIAATIGYASGEEHPNVVLDKHPEDTEYTDTYSGFIPLQEIYSGKRVRSYFVVGGQIIPRPLTAPSADVDPARQRYAVNPSGFTNIVYTGAGITWTPEGYAKKTKINSGVLYYWQDSPSKGYYLAYHNTETDYSHSLDCNASKALGLEINASGDINLLDNLKGVLAMAVFIPGAHYSQIIGKPINSNQFKEATSTTRYGVDFNAYPLVNKSVSYIMNLAFEYMF
jgi:hypothetical protein